MSTAPPEVFDPLAPLARGAAVIEASAGTGKTYQITNLVLRLVAEQGVGIDELLVVTFTNAATAELRERVRGRIVEAIVALEAVEAGGPPPADPVLAHLAHGVPEERRPRLDALRLAREDFDAAAISTIHGFCRTVLQEYAFEAEVDLQAELVDGPGPLLEELVDDWLVRRLHDCPAAEHAALRRLAGVTRARLRKVAEASVGAHDVKRLPDRPFDAPAFARLATQGAAAWAREGRAKLVGLASAVRPTNYFTFKKDGTPKDHFENELDRIAASLAAATAGPDALAACDDPFEFEKLETAWAALRPAEVPGLAELAQLVEALAARPSEETRAFLAFVEAELPRRMAQRGQRSFTDLLSLVSDAIRDAPDGELVRGLRRRYRGVLIDEFQDTDTTQWSIFHDVFALARDEAGWPSHWLYLIGDPKQAIYAFRNADVFVYLDARREAARQATMIENHRSDGRLVHAMNTLFADTERVFEQEGLPYVKVAHAARNGWDERLRRAGAPPDEAPLQVRWVDARTAGPTSAAPYVLRGKPFAAALVTRTVADDICRLLTERPLLELAGTPPVPLHPGHLAVLVRTNREARRIERALLRRGVPCITAATDDVFSSDEAAHLLTWLRAVASPRDAALARRLATTPLGDFTARELAAVAEGDDRPQRWPGWLSRLARLSERFARDGFASTFGAFLGDERVLTRLASLEEGERRITNYRHLLELLHVVASEERLSALGLARWLADRRASPQSQAQAELRLESDARAVHIVTLHKSKGLQYPFVFVPFLWSRRKERSSDAAVRWHEDGKQVVDLRFGRPGSAERLAAQESRWEDLRLLYVGLTRAQHRVSLYFALQYTSRSKETARAPLTQLLFGAGGGAPRSVLAEARFGKELDAPRVAGLERCLDELVTESRAPDGRPTIGWSHAAPPAGDDRVTLPDASAPVLAPPRSFPSERGLELVWRRASFSSLVGERHVTLVEQARLADPRGAGTQDEPPDDEAPTVEVGDVPLADFPRGTEAGTFVHRVLELIDFPSLRERGGRRRDLEALVREEGPRYGIHEPGHQARFVEELPNVLRTPLGAGLPSLAELPVADRLDELTFDLAVRGGDDFGATQTTPMYGADLRALFGEERPAGSPIPPAYLAEVRAHGFAFPELAGFLTGSIDLAFRVGTGPDQRWYVCDYKTNALHSRDADDRRSCTPAHFGPVGLAQEMAKHHYFLQYHLYLLALHRFLQQRLPGYTPERNLGGAVYAFVRGMLGPSTAPGHGVFFDRPEPAWLARLDRLLDRAPGAADERP